MSITMSNYNFVVNDEPINEPINEPIKLTDRELTVLQMMKCNAELPEGKS